MTLTLLPQSVYAQKTSRAIVMQHLLHLLPKHPLLLPNSKRLSIKVKTLINEPISEFGTILFTIDSSILMLNMQEMNRYS